MKGKRIMKGKKMKKKWLPVLTAAMLFTAVVPTVAEEAAEESEEDPMAVQIINEWDAEDTEPVSLDDIKVGISCEIPDYAMVEATSFEWVDQLGYFAQGRHNTYSSDYTGYIGSGNDAEYALLKMDLMNLSMGYKDFLQECEVNITTKLTDLSTEIQEQLSPTFEEYGLKLEHFSVASIKISGLERIGNALEDVRIRIINEDVESDIQKKKIDVDAKRIQIEGAARNAVKRESGMIEATINHQKGISEQEQQAFEIAKALAQNQGSSNITLSMPKKTSSVIMSPACTAKDIVQTVFNGAAVREDDFEKRLDRLKMVYEKGMISKESYEARINEIINEI